MCAEMTGALARPVPVSLSTSTSTQTGYAEGTVYHSHLNQPTLVITKTFQYSMYFIRNCDIQTSS